MPATFQYASDWEGNKLVNRICVVYRLAISHKHDLKRSKRYPSLLIILSEKEGKYYQIMKNAGGNIKEWLYTKKKDVFWRTV